MFSEGISEIVLVVEDVEASARFYRDVVGLVPRTEPEEGWAWFWAGPPGRTQSVGLREGTLLFEGMSPRPEGERWGPVHYAFEVPRERLAEAVEHVRSSGVEVYGPIHFDWMKADSYYFYDPDDNFLEFWSPDSANREETPHNQRSVIPEDYLDLLEKPTFAHVATIGPRGEPQSTPVWIDWDGEHVKLSHTKGQQKYRNLQRDPRIALSILDPEDPYRCLEIRGAVERIEEDANLAFANAMAKKYLGVEEYPWHQPGDERVVVMVKPQRAIQC